MIVSLQALLGRAQAAGYAVGAFNVYNLEGIRAVVNGAMSEGSPVILQIHSPALRYGGTGLIKLACSEAEDAAIPMAVHFDHSASAEEIESALDAGVTSVMADGSELPYEENVAFVRHVVDTAREYGAGVEAELGRLTGTEDGIDVEKRGSWLTDPEQSGRFTQETGVDALAVCIGNVHGPYPSQPDLDFERLAAIRDAVEVPLVLHGSSGLSRALTRRTIELGICKLNINTDLRRAYLERLRELLHDDPSIDLVPLMSKVTYAMERVVADRVRLFSSG